MQKTESVSGIWKKKLDTSYPSSKSGGACAQRSHATLKREAACSCWIHPGIEIALFTLWLGGSQHPACLKWYWAFVEEEAGVVMGSRGSREPENDGATPSSF